MRCRLVRRMTMRWRTRWGLVRASSIVTVVGVVVVVRSAALPRSALRTLQFLVSFEGVKST